MGGATEGGREGKMQTDKKEREIRRERKTGGRRYEVLGNTG